MVNAISHWRSQFLESYGVLPPLLARTEFLAFCKIEEECWVWKGEPTYQIGRRRYDPLHLAHVFLIGTLSPDVAVRSTCGKTCCMPDHLECFTESKLSARIAKCEAAPMSAEEREWIDASPVGREVI